MTIKERKRILKEELLNVDKRLGLTGDKSLLSMAEGNKDMWVKWSMPYNVVDELPEEENAIMNVFNVLNDYCDIIGEPFTNEYDSIVNTCVDYAFIQHSMFNGRISNEMKEKFFDIMKKCDVFKLFERLNYKGGVRFYVEDGEDLYRVSILGHESNSISVLKCVGMVEDDGMDINFSGKYTIVHTNTPEPVVEEGRAVIKEEHVKSGGFTAQERCFLVAGIVCYAYLQAITGGKYSPEELNHVTEYVDVDFWDKDTYINDDLVLVER